MDWLRKLLGKAESWDGSDRRSALRVPCVFEVQVTGARCSFLGKSKDIGPTGIRIEARGAFPDSLKPKLAIQIKHLSAPMDCDRDVVTAQVAWVRRKNAGLYQFAATFQEDIESLRRSWVRSVLAKAIKQPPKQKRRYLRVRCERMVAAFLNGEVVEVKLRDLSVQGARLEVLREVSQKDSLALRLEQMKVACEIRRVARANGVYVVGVNFQPDPAQAKKLLELIKSLNAAATK